LKVIFKQSLARDLKRIRNKSLLQRVQDVIEQLEQVSSLDEFGHTRKISDSKVYYRIRIGDYRLGLRLENNIVTLIRFLHRKDIYRYFP
jgi:mRNA interferase RelE/StbE